jgi:hypothetical protein
LFAQQVEEQPDACKSAIPAFTIALRSDMFFKSSAATYVGGSFCEENLGGITARLQPIPEVPSWDPARRLWKAMMCYDLELPTSCYRGRGNQEHIMDGKGACQDERCTLSNKFKVAGRRIGYPTL